MGLFENQAEVVKGFINEKKDSLTSLSEPEGWPRESGLVLEEDTAIELGNPAGGSLEFLLWTDSSNFPHDRVLLLGPDVPNINQKSAPFAQVVMAAGSFDQEYECYQDLKDTVYETRLEGYMARVLPSRRTVWARVGREAYEKGFSLAHLGWAIVRELRELEFVTRVTVLFVTSSKEDAEALAPAARETSRIAAALVRMNEEMSFDCDTCDYRDVCDTVAELKVIRKKLKEDRA
ncbi:MAG: hypothetical protein R6V10_03470 [bacterium]